MAVVRLVIGAGGGEHAPPKLTDDAKQAVIERFTASVGAVRDANRDNRSWWYTWLSCRDRLNSPLLGWLEMAAHVAATDRDVTIGVPSAAVAREIRAAATGAGHEVIMGGRARVALALIEASSVVRWSREVARFVMSAIRAKALSRRIPLPEPRTLDVVLVTNFEQRSARPGGWRDAYFGDLAEHLTRTGERVAVVGQLRNTSAEIVDAARRTSGGVLASAGLAHVSDIFVAAWRGLAPGIRTAPAGVDRRLVRNALRAEAGSIAAAWLLERSLSRLLAAHPDARLIHLFENNAWERAVDIAAETATPPRPTTGYLHCAVVPAHLKYRFDRQDDVGRPAPDLVVCTGPTARDVLLSLGDLEPTRVAVGCALNGPDVGALEPVVKPAALRRILVLLEGLWTMAPLVRIAAEVASAGDCDVLLRSHPALPADDIAARAGVEIRGRLSISAEPDLLTDLRSADAVAYKGTTTALMALALGVPAIHVDTGELLTDDPLFACTALKRTARNASEVLEAARELLEIGDGPFAVERATARAFVASYLTPITDEGLRAFERTR